MSAGCAPTVRIAATARATTPRCAPTRPACTAATTPARASASSTGTQSAVTTTSASPGTAVTSASAPTRPPTAALCGPATTSTRSPCTWFIHTRRSGPKPVASASRERLAAADAHRRPVGGCRYACGLDRLEERRGDLARLPGGDRVSGLADTGRAGHRLAPGPRAVEAGRDNRDPHFVAERIVDDRAEDDVGVLVCGVLDQ